MKRADTTLYDGKNLISALTVSGAAPAAAADGIAGVWVTLLDMNAMTATSIRRASFRSRSAAPRRKPQPKKRP